MKIDLTHGILTFTSKRQPGTPPSECDGLVERTFPGKGCVRFDEAQSGEAESGKQVELEFWDCPKCQRRVVLARTGDRTHVRNEYAIPAFTALLADPPAKLKTTRTSAKAGNHAIRRNGHR